MTDLYSKVDTRIRDSLLLLDSSSNAVTGEVPGNFTLALYQLGVGDIVTTGITISEMDAVNEPGEYELDMNPLTSFVIATGVYCLTVHNTTHNQWFKSIYLITADGTGAGTIGPNIFTASSGDGRVTDGVLPVEGVTVFILDSNNNLITTALTDVNGDWGPVYLEDGSFTATAQLIGFTGASAVLTMAGGGGSIGSDIVITVASALGTVTNGALVAYTRRQSGDQGGDKANIQIQECVNAGLQKAARDHFSNFYQTDAKILLRAQFTTGTVALTLGSKAVVLTGGIWPSWAANGELLVNGVYLEIDIRTDDTNLILVDDWVEANVAAATFNLSQLEYAQPADLMAVGVDIWYQGSARLAADPTTYIDIQRWKRQGSFKGDRVWASHRKKFVIYPVVSTDSYADYFYYRSPVVLDFASPNTVADMDPLNIALVQRGIDTELVIRGIYAGGLDDPSGAYEKELLRMRRNDSVTTGRNRVRDARGGRSRLGNSYSGN